MERCVDKEVFRSKESAIVSQHLSRPQLIRNFILCMHPRCVFSLSAVSSRGGTWCTSLYLREESRVHYEYWPLTGSFNRRSFRRRPTLGSSRVVFMSIHIHLPAPAVRNTPQSSGPQGPCYLPVTLPEKVHACLPFGLFKRGYRDAQTRTCLGSEERALTFGLEVSLFSPNTFQPKQYGTSEPSSSLY